jgi:hypothetical protein
VSNGRSKRLLTAAEADALEARVGLRLAARLSEGTDTVPHDIGERLRVAREQALARAAHARRKAAVEAVQVAPVMHVVPVGASTLAMGTGPGQWWWRLGSFLPLALLVAGLLAIHELNDNEAISATAEVDAALLADVVPPDAYADPGFAEFLNQPLPAPDAGSDAR